MYCKIGSADLDENVVFMLCRTYLEPLTMIQNYLKKVIKMQLSWSQLSRVKKLRVMLLLKLIPTVDHFIIFLATFEAPVPPDLIYVNHLSCHVCVTEREFTVILELKNWTLHDVYHVVRGDNETSSTTAWSYRHHSGIYGVTLKKCISWNMLQHALYHCYLGCRKC